MASIFKTSASRLFVYHRLLKSSSSQALLKLHTIDSYVIPPTLRNPSPIPKDPVKEPPREPIEYEVSQSPEEWKFVERLIPPVEVPQPTLKDEYPSGWRPPSVSAVDLPYFVSRTKNHMLNVFLDRRLRGQLIQTKIRKISGDIWALNEDLLLFLKEKHKKNIVSHVNEVICCIWLKGDYVRDVEQWMLSKGF